MSDFILEPPTDREHTTDEEGCKRIGYVPGESEVESASKPLPSLKEDDKEKEKDDKVDVDADLADQALKSLSLDSNPLPAEEDVDNGADCDVVPDSDVHVDEDSSLPTVQEKSTSSDKGNKKSINIMEAASSAEGGLELSFAQDQEGCQGSTHGCNGCSETIFEGC